MPKDFVDTYVIKVKRTLDHPALFDAIETAIEAERAKGNLENYRIEETDGSRLRGSKDKL